MRPEHSHGPTFKHLLLLLLTVFTSGWGLAQADGVLIEGELRHKKTREPLQNVTVTVMVEDDIVDSFDADARYSYEVPHDGDYVLMFGAIDMVPQSVQVNASQVPEALRGDMDPLTWDVSLFDYLEDFDMSVVDEPFGIFDFDEDRESMELDRSHSSQMRVALDDEMERLDNQGEEAERNQRYYEYAMEDAQKAERKGRWAAAKEEYAEALEFKPGDAEAAAGLERANLALNPELADDEVIEEEPPAEEPPTEESQSSAEDVLPEVQDQKEREATSSRASSQDANDDPLPASTEKEAKEVVDDRPDDSIREEAANNQGGASVLSAPVVPIRTVSAKELSDAEDAEEYFRQARIAEKQAELNQIRQKNRTLNEVDRQVAAEADKLADEAMVETVQKRRLAQEIDEAVSLSHQESILEHRTKARAHEAVEAERIKANAERTAEEIVELRGLQAAQRTRPDRPFLDPEMDDVPQGVTQTNQKMPNGEGIVITRIVRVGNVIKRYRKVITKLGTFYYCGDRSITKTQWGLETNLTQ
jgi:hypothetical protein